MCLNIFFIPQFLDKRKGNSRFLPLRTQYNSNGHREERGKTKLSGIPGESPSPPCCEGHQRDVCKWLCVRQNTNHRWDKTAALVWFASGI
ncbi:hypothetical protein TNCT_119391 [Trichonephila clavata]|uniref:Uncharacterized protein n=1 Tax=Trichonephila clavata TaxID=2740835 RepID=A0A8X6FQ16_TRICU|nr:hypothetical protein TNCT_119391 [Trichonephila clavata]